MSIKIVRFNKREEVMLRKLLAYYGKDFSNCVKALMEEKLEDLVDVGLIKKFRESTPESYLSAKEIDSLYEDDVA